MTKHRQNRARWAGPVIDRSSGRVIVEKLERADTWFARFKGLLGRQRLEEGTGLYLEPCRQVHCFFMKFPIDVVFVDELGHVVGIEQNLRPWRIGRYHPKAVAALELPCGTIERFDLRAGVSVLDGLRQPSGANPSSMGRKREKGQDLPSPNATVNSKESPDDRKPKPKPQCFH